MNESDSSSLGSAVPQRSRFIALKNVCLGRGSFGIVYKGIDNATGGYVAMKVADIGSNAAASQLAREMCTLSGLEHSNVVRFIAVESEQSSAHMVMELLPGGSVQSVVGSLQFRLSEHVIRSYFRQLLAGLAFLHSKFIVHRDVKPGNMLLTADGTVKLSDFGLCRVVQVAATATNGSLGGTPCYMAPEIITGNKMAFGGDIWAAACTVVELATGKPPWSHLGEEQLSNPFSLVFRIGTSKPPDHHPPIPDHLSQALRDILCQCFEYEHEARPSAEQLLAKAYFSNSEVPDDAESLEAYSASLENARDRSSEDSVQREMEFEEFTAPEANMTIATMSGSINEKQQDPPPRTQAWGLPKQIVEYEDDNSAWRRVPDSMAQAVIAGLSSSEACAQKFKSSANRRTYELDLAKMEQRNVQTGKRRKLRVRRGVFRRALRPAFFNERSQWVEYEAALTAQIVEALSTQDRFLLHTVRGRQYEIDLHALVQRNTDTNVRRLVSLRPEDRQPPTRLLQYMSETGEWKDFDQALSRLLLHALNMGHSVQTVQSGNSTYVMDMAAGTQMNSSTGKSRQIRVSTLPGL